MEAMCWEASSLRKLVLADECGEGALERTREKLDWLLVLVEVKRLQSGGLSP